jgi:exodeoxyribonuclease VII small subunit
MAKKTFEQIMQQLEQIVEELEAGDLPLEKAMKKFEEGMKYSKQCTDLLEETEKKITLLLQKENGNVEEKPFASSEIPVAPSSSMDKDDEK